MIFISYSHADKPMATRLGEALEAIGQHVFIDEWDIQPGDSIVQKIFEHGIRDAQAFLVLVSDHSVRSDWVREELDQATVRRIEGLTRVIPVKLDDAPMPVTLRTLKWIDVRGGVDEAATAIVDAVRGVRRRPPLGPEPAHIRDLPRSIGGLSPSATQLGLHMLESIDQDTGDRFEFTGDELTEALQQGHQLLNDSVDELEEYGLVRTLKTLGSAPYEFWRVIPTYSLYSHFSDALDYRPAEDIVRVIAAIASLGQVDGPALQAATDLSYGRLNRAVEFIKDYGLAEVTQWMGTHPYLFGQIDATRKTRQAAELP